MPSMTPSTTRQAGAAPCRNRFPNSIPTILPASRSRPADPGTNPPVPIRAATRLSRGVLVRIPSGASSSCAIGLKTTARAAQRRLPTNCFYYYRRYVDRSFLFSSLYDQTDYVVNRCGIALHISRHLQFIRATHNIHVGSIIVGH